MPVPSTLQSRETAEYLRRMLANAGFVPTQPDPALAWSTFKAFAAIPVECSDDAFLFQCGVFDFTGQSQFHFDFTRQFSFDVDEEYDHMEQLNFTLYADPAGPFRTLETNLWSYDCASLDDFFQRVEHLLEFRTVMNGPRPTRAMIEFGDV